MTIDEFVERLAKLNIEWDLTPGGRMRPRYGYPYTCPIVAMDGGEGCAFWDHYQSLGLKHEDAEAIAITADRANHSPCYDPKLRTKLLNAVGLKEV